MKGFQEALAEQLLAEKLKTVPIVQKCEIEKTRAADLTVWFVDGARVCVEIKTLPQAYPKQVLTAIQAFRPRNCHLVLFLDYASEQTDRICAENHVSYLDRAGNCRIAFHSLYLLEKGNPNRLKSDSSLKSLFSSSSVVTSTILRVLLSDPKRPWKLKNLAQACACSIGQVSKVKNFLCEQLWAEMGKTGFYLTDPKRLLESWSKSYKLQAAQVHPCYTLLPLAEFEHALQLMRNSGGPENYLTGFAGGVRYAPVVRYNKVHVLVPAGQTDAFLHKAPCKPVDSGANVVVYAIEREDLLVASRLVNGFRVVSPVQAYLDCMQLSGRAEELAQAICERGIGI